VNAQPRYRCHACGATFAARALAERHADAEHHHRVEILLAPAPVPTNRQKKGAR
jgi:transposase-like protein